MRYSPVELLRKFVLRQNIRHLVETSETCIWVNLTFWENVTNKKFASECWHDLSKRIEREYPGCRFVGVWARQERGAWHIHGVADRRLDVNWLRLNAVGCGFGPQMFLKQLDNNVRTPEWIARYISGYCTDKNALDSVRDKGVRRLIFVGSKSRVVDMRYRSSLKQITSLGRDLDKEMRFERDKFLTEFERDFLGDGRKKIWESWGQWYKRNRDYWFKVGWEALSDADRDEFLICDEFTSRYIETGRWSYV